MNRIKTIALFALAAVFTAPVGAQFYRSPNACDPDPAPRKLTVAYPFPGAGEARSFKAEIHLPQNIPSGVTHAAAIWSHG